jgi:group I intron endonuclease
MIYSIYKATSITTKKNYIGFCTDLNHRRRTHKYAALVKNKTTPFYQAIRQYGWEDFAWEVIYCSLDKDHTLQEMEPHFIHKYNSLFPSGYNARKGGGFVPFKNPQNAQYWIILFPDGHQERIFNLSQFCREHILNMVVMSRIAGTGRSHKGYRCAKRLEELKTIAPPHKKKSLDSVIRGVQTRRQNGRYFYNAPFKERHHSEKTKQIISEAKIGKSMPISFVEKHSTRWRIIPPTGDPFEITNLSQWCRNNNMNQGDLHSTSQQVNRTCKGYKCEKISPVKVYVRKPSSNYPNYWGRKAAPETIVKLRESHLGQTPWNTGKLLSDEHKKKISKSHKGRYPSEETKQKMSNSHKGHYHSEESKLKISLTKQRQKRTQIC